MKQVVENADANDVGNVVTGTARSGPARTTELNIPGYDVAAPGPKHRLKACATLLLVAAAGLLAQQAQTFHVRPLRPIEELRQEALRAQPPREKGTLRKPELVDLAALRAPLRFEIRYATPNNFLGAPVYSQARAFLERPAADALLAAAGDLQARGYGLLIYDGYRPWYVTKIFWDATPARLHTFVADPSKGSKHNRGCAVDLTLYDLKSGAPVEMPSGYDEMTVRAHPDYAGGPAAGRAHRAILRGAMEAHGFTVDPGEWWHFDFSQWRQFPILNIRFESLPGTRPARLQVSRQTEPALTPM